MKGKLLYTLIIIFGINTLKSQYLPKDTLYGKVKEIREKVIFLTEIENPQLLYYDDYGHSGFMGPESTIARFKDTWYTSQMCYYLNYHRFFDAKGNVIKDIWYGKKGNFMNAYRKIYNEKNKIQSEIDSTNYSIYTKNYFYSDYGDVNIISQNMKYNSFSHVYKNYDKEKLNILKTLDKEGVVDEYKYFYNDKGKLIYRIYKNPNSWKQIDEHSWTYGVHDTIGSIYKDIINEYDVKNRLIKSQQFDLYQDDKEHKNPKITRQTNYVYKDDNLITTIRVYASGEPTFTYYTYDKKKRVIEKYCCDKDTSKPMIVEKFKYNDNRIIGLNYTEDKKNYKVSFRYKYDQNNNWIEIIKNVDGKDLFKWVREIQYYK
ncbi:hypothetical protein [Elizabethkingia anophelis]|uniref:hypothetical protein n=1 Tax=Elizabethkingia anophelis TaxID=1117645 RepID=UPI0021A4905C|nr:hypothetical protein [Elizabethkingia anophelis]